MGIVITKGYLINKIDYSTFDSIITLLNEHGNKFSCIALGVRKINSKNARSLNLGNFNEFEFFLARDINKISKLKRSTTIVETKWPNYDLSFYLLNEIINRIPTTNIQYYEFYKKNLQLINCAKNSVNFSILIILREFCKISGIDLYIKNCVICHNNKIKTMSFKKHGLICEQCWRTSDDELYNLKVSRLIYDLFNFTIEESHEYENEYPFLIKLLRNYIKDNLGLNLETLRDY